MSQHHASTTRAEDRSEAGATLIELMIAVAVLMIVSASVFNGVQQLTRVGETVNNRSKMHAGVRNATELLQQEVGQAGSVSLPAAMTLAAGVVANLGVAQAVPVSSVDGLFVGEKLVVDAGANQETVSIAAIDTFLPSISAIFTIDHAAATPITVQGGFSAGIVPPTLANGSTATVLKMFGDINGDGRMVYVEYSCDIAAGNLYRNAMAFDVAGPKPAPDVSQVLLNNIQPNPGGTPCFTYQTKTVTGTTFVTDVAITLTVQTERRDPVTGVFQTETKALLNVSPRSVFQVWQMATMNMNDRVQPMPPTVAVLLM